MILSLCFGRENQLAPQFGGLYIRSLQLRRQLSKQGQKSKTPNSKPASPDWQKVPGRYRSGQTGQTVNLLAYAFSGSNPLLPMALLEPFFECLSRSPGD